MEYYSESQMGYIGIAISCPKLNLVINCQITYQISDLNDKQKASLIYQVNLWKIIGISRYH